MERQQRYRILCDRVKHLLRAWCGVQIEDEEMKFLPIREFFLAAALCLSVVATAQTFGDQLRIDALQRTSTQVDDHEKRIIHLEDAMAQMVIQSAESREEEKWWLRGIGGAIMLAIAERVLRTAGVLGKSDGAGPVG